MSAASAPGPSARHPSHARHLASLPRRAYGLRVLGMGLGSLPAMVVFHEVQAPWPAWTWMLLACFAWPHLAYWRARRSREPFRAELHNLIFDSFLAASLPPLMHYNVLPSVMLLSVVFADKLSVGVSGLWLRSLPGMAVALLGFGLFTGFAFRPASSMAVVLASLPILVIHTLAVSLSTFRLVRRVRRQNQQLERLSRTDALTGLHNRGHWESEVEAMLATRVPGTQASLLLVDLDEFKGVNDTHGHTAGDDVLRAIGALALHHAGASGLAGRLGGDELALVLPMDVVDAMVVAERLRDDVAALRFEAAPGLRCAISIGAAALPARQADLRTWMDAADRAMYRDKQLRREAAMEGETTDA